MSQTGLEGFSKTRIFASSIPHLLHWDLAYLWMLECPPEYVSPSWQQPLENWRNLLRCLFAGLLEVREIPAGARLHQLLTPWGYDPLRILTYEEKPVGLLSPLCLLRPFPDGNPVLPKLDDADLARARKALQLNVDSLSEFTSNSRIAAPVFGTLLRILEKEALELPVREVQVHADSLEVPLLTDTPPLFFRADFLAGGKPGIEIVKLHYCRRQQVFQNAYIPRCNICQDTLLRPEDAPSVPVDGEAVELQCANRHTTRIALEHLFLWRRPLPNGAIEYVHWTERGGLDASGGEALYPPEVELNASSVIFRWNPGQCNDSKRTTLRLEFPAPVRQASVLSDVLYSRLLLLGNERPDNKSNLPFRWEWLDAVIPDSISVEPTSGGFCFNGLRLRGLPFSFSYSYDFMTNRLQDCGVAVFPGLELHRNWRRRIFLAGKNASACRLLVEGASLAEGDSAFESQSFPARLAVQSVDDKNCGASFFLDSPPQPAPPRGPVYLGIDFGTTNSVVYFTNDASRSISTKNNAFSPLEIRNQIYWLRTPDQPDQQLGDTWWLPAQQGEVLADDYLTPSALWKTRCGNYIRWHQAPPPGSAEPVTGFKWDEGLKDNGPLRLAFLRELLFWSLPVILKKLGGPDQAADIHCAVAFPLAFSHSQRLQMANTLRQLGEKMASVSGHKFLFSSIDESRASMTALGAPNVGTLSLVADLGGRTLDVVLFETTSNKPGASPQIHQVGSVDLGAEVFVESLCQGDQLRAWTLRDTIRSGHAKDAFGGNKLAQDKLDRLHVLALDFVRTMAAAHLERLGAGANAAIRLLLIGNGWRLRDLFAGKKNPDQAFLDWAETRIGNTGLASLGLNRDALPGIDRTKHYVAIGALKHVASGGSHELESQDSSSGSCLPAGRKVTFEGSGDSWEWHELIGDSGKRFRNVAAARQGSIDIHIRNHPRLSKDWSIELSGFLEDLPADNLVREWILAAAEGDFLMRGPLQILIENYWKGKI